jgi:hypothetical protein
MKDRAWLRTLLADGVLIVASFDNAKDVAPPCRLLHPCR